MKKLMTEQERKDSRSLTNHLYYIRNHTKWQTDYKKSEASMVGTGSLGEHRLDNEEDEMLAIQKEMKNLGLRKRREYFSEKCYVEIKKEEN